MILYYPACNKLAVQYDCLTAHSSTSLTTGLVMRCFRIRSLADDVSVRLNGESRLFYFMVLCSYANFRTSTVRIDDQRYTLAPGEWMMPIRELMKIYRLKTEMGTAAVLEELQQNHYIRYNIPDDRSITGDIVCYSAMLTPTPEYGISLPAA